MPNPLFMKTFKGKNQKSDFEKNQLHIGFEKTRAHRPIPQLLEANRTIQTISLCASERATVMMDTEGDVVDVDLIESHGLGVGVDSDFFDDFEDLFDESDMVLV
jgi:hypothetical protein